MEFGKNGRQIDVQYNSKIGGSNVVNDGYTQQSQQQATYEDM